MESNTYSTVFKSSMTLSAVRLYDIETGDPKTLRILDISQFHKDPKLADKFLEITEQAEREMAAFKQGEPIDWGVVREFFDLQRDLSRRGRIREGKSENDPVDPWPSHLFLLGNSEKWDRT